MAAVSRAELVEITYTEYVRNMLQLSQEITKARGLNALEGRTAQTWAAAWVHLGPCKGNPPGNIKPALSQSVISMMLTADPSLPLDAAILENVALLTRENFGREPPEYVCRFALETAAAFKSVGRR
jgi:hypothetical protein